MSSVATDPVPIANLLRMAFYAGDFLDELDSCEAGHDDGCHFVELLGRMLANAALRIRRGGYQRGYHEEVDRSSRPRGRILLRESLASASLPLGRLVHSHDEFDAEAPDNRVLKASIAHLRNGPSRTHLRPETEADLALVHTDLHAVRSMRLDNRLLASLPHGPAGRRYRTARFVARILADGLQPDAEQFGDHAVQLLQDARRMRTVFERFVARFAQGHAPSGSRVRRPKYTWEPGEEAVVDPRIPALQPDAVLRSEDASRVVECKYTPRLLEAGLHDATARFRSAHLQQLFCYLTMEARRGKPPTGLLVYPRVGMSMCVEMRLGPFPTTVATLDLTRPWSELVVELCALLFQ